MVLNHIWPTAAPEGADVPRSNPLSFNPECPLNLAMCSNSYYYASFMTSYEAKSSNVEAALAPPLSTSASIR